MQIEKFFLFLGCTMKKIMDIENRELYGYICSITWNFHVLVKKESKGDRKLIYGRLFVL